MTDIPYEFWLEQFRERGFCEVDLRVYAKPCGKLAHEYIDEYNSASPVTIVAAYRAEQPTGEWECTAYYTSDGKRWFEATDGNPPSEITEDVWGCNAFIYDKDRGYLADGKPICPEGWY